MKVIINTCYGGFSLSEKALSRLGKLNDDLPHKDSVRYRSNPELVQVVEELGEEANGKNASLKVINIPEGDDEQYIVSQAGKEHVVVQYR